MLLFTEGLGIIISPQVFTQRKNCFYLTYYYLIQAMELIVLTDNTGSSIQSFDILLDDQPGHSDVF